MYRLTLSFYALVLALAYFWPSFWIWSLVLLTVVLAVASVINDQLWQLPPLLSPVPNDGGVLLTGTSTGIGRLTALELVRSGWHVYATVRKAEDGESLKTAAGERADHIHPLLLDLAHTETIPAAVAQLGEQLKQRSLRLHGVIHNAGYGAFAALEVLGEADLQRQFQVNVFATVSLTNAVLPLLRETQGRVVFVGSEGGSVAIPGSAAYQATKHALEAIADGYRRELSKWGVRVSMMQPGAFRTGFMNTALPAGGDPYLAKASWLPADVRDVYADLGRRFEGFSRRYVEPGLPAADTCAVRLDRCMRTRWLPIRVPVGSAWTSVPLLGFILPDSVLDALLVVLLRFAPIHGAGGDTAPAPAPAAPAAAAATTATTAADAAPAAH